MANGATIAGSIPPTVYYLIDQSARNWLNLSIEGIDAQFDYTFDIGDKVNARFGASGTYFTKFDQNFGDEPGVLGAQYVGLQRRVLVDPVQGAAPTAAWTSASSPRTCSGTTSAATSNWSGSTFTPLTRDANGNPNGGGDTVDATNTFDLHVAYQLELGGIDRGYEPVAGCPQPDR